MSVEILVGDCRKKLLEIPEGTVNCCVTSPPYFGLRDYGHEGQIGLEDSPAAYIEKLVEVFREVRRTLRDDGTLWLNLGDSYAGSWGAQSKKKDPKEISRHSVESHPKGRMAGSLKFTPGLKNKDLIGIPWRAAFALQADGWYLRSAIPWLKRNCMPESVADRPTTAIEYVFLFSKSESYYYDAAAVASPVSVSGAMRRDQDIDNQAGSDRAHGLGVKGSPMKAVGDGKTRNRRNSEWFFDSWQGLLSDENGDPLAFVVNPVGYKGAHFATWPPKLVQPMILAGAPPQGIVLDPFGGSGTTGEVAEKNGRNSILVELNPDYIELAKGRTSQTGLFFGEAAS